MYYSLLSFAVYLLAFSTDIRPCASWVLSKNILVQKENWLVHLTQISSALVAWWINYSWICTTIHKTTEKLKLQSKCFYHVSFHVLENHQWACYLSSKTWPIVHRTFIYSSLCFIGIWVLNVPHGYWISYGYQTSLYQKLSNPLA